MSFPVTSTTSSYVLTSTSDPWTPGTPPSTSSTSTSSTSSTAFTSSASSTSFSSSTSTTSSNSSSTLGAEPGQESASSCESFGSSTVFAVLVSFIICIGLICLALAFRLRTVQRKLNKLQAEVSKGKGRLDGLRDDLPEPSDSRAAATAEWVQHGLAGVPDRVRQGLASTLRKAARSLASDEPTSQAPRGHRGRHEDIPLGELPYAQKYRGEEFVCPDPTREPPSGGFQSTLAASTGTFDRYSNAAPQVRGLTRTLQNLDTLYTPPTPDYYAGGDDGMPSRTAAAAAARSQDRRSLGEVMGDEELLSRLASVSKPDVRFPFLAEEDDLQGQLSGREQIYGNPNSVPHSEGLPVPPHDDRHLSEIRREHSDIPRRRREDGNVGTQPGPSSPVQHSYRVDEHIADSDIYASRSAIRAILAGNDPTAHLRPSPLHIQKAPSTPSHGSFPALSRQSAEDYHDDRTVLLPSTVYSPPIRKPRQKQRERSFSNEEVQAAKNRLETRNSLPSIQSQSDAFGATLSRPSHEQAYNTIYQAASQARGAGNEAKHTDSDSEGEAMNKRLQTFLRRPSFEEPPRQNNEAVQPLRVPSPGRTYSDEMRSINRILEEHMTFSP